MSQGQAATVPDDSHQETGSRFSSPPDLHSGRSDRRLGGGDLGTDPIDQAGTGMNRRECPLEPVDHGIFFVQTRTAPTAPVHVLRDASPTRQDILKFLRG
jgi:hypothetical protein